MGKPVALGYLRKDVSGVAQTWHENQIRSLAKRSGYNLAKIIVFSADTEQPIDALIGAARRIGADAVFTFSAAHFDEEGIPSELTKVVDVVTVSPEHTHARWSLHPSRWNKKGSV
ncbi:hypothetical protein [Nocardia colli]|uniref:hypothetical protein n=1 Tax=Nocardia colli TaxID=2545717 RepID=UPI0035D8D2F6